MFFYAQKVARKVPTPLGLDFRDFRLFAIFDFFDLGFQISPIPRFRPRAGKDFSTTTRVISKIFIPRGEGALIPGNP